MAAYLQSKLRFDDEQIVVEDDGTQVMMSWERPLMRRMAEIACMRRGDVLEVGFGMGISCEEVQKLRPRSHTIVEAHPEIAERARVWAKKLENVTILEGRWQDVLPQLQNYDGVSFDVFGGDAQREAFFSHLHKLLRPRGTATLWLADDHVMPESLNQVLVAQGFHHAMNRVSAIPDPRCTYSRSNIFSIPTIFRREATS